MRKFIGSMVGLLLVGTLVSGCAGQGGKTAQGASGPLKIGITQIVEHPALDDVRKGAIDALAAAGYHDEKEIQIDFKSAQATPSIAQQIAQSFAADKKDLIIAISTPSAAMAAQEAEGIPIVFGTVYDPVAAGFVESIEKPGGLLTGTSDKLPVKEILALFGQLGVPVKNVGVIYNAGEDNSVAIIDEAKAAAPELGLTLVEATVANANEVQQAAQSLVDRVDAFFLHTDNTLAQGVQGVIDLANERMLPTVGATYADQGVLIEFGFDWYAFGVQTGEMAVEVLKGKKPSEIPVQVGTDYMLYVNKGTLAHLGLTLPQEILDKATFIE